MQTGTKRLALTGVVVVAALGIGGYFVLRAPHQSSGSVPTGAAAQKAAQPGGQAGRSRAGRRGGGGRDTRVVTAKVAMRVIGNRVAAVGTGRALRSLTLSAQVSGVIEEIRFSPGQTVREGQPLVVLQSEAERIAVKLAKVKVDDAAATVARYETLLARNAAPSVQLEQARTALATAKAELEAKEYELRRRTITAPFGGVMGITTLTVGDYLKEGSAIATIDDRSKLIVEFVISERAATFVRLGQDVRLSTPTLRGIVFHGKVSALDSRIDTASRTLRVEATVPNDDNRLIPGMTFSVSIRIEGETLPTVPGHAIQWDRSGAHVWLVTPERKAKRVQVQIRRRENDLVTVEAKLKKDDQVVVEGLDYLRDGASVTLAQDGEGGGGGRSRN